MRFSKLALAIVVAASCGVVERAAAQVVATTTSLTWGKDAAKRRSVPFQPSPATTVVTNLFPVFWDRPADGHLYATIGVPPNIRPGQFLTDQDLRTYFAASVNYEAPNHDNIIQEMDMGSTVEITARIGSPNGDPISTNVEYGRIRIGIASDGEIQLGRPENITITIPPGFAPVTQVRIDFGARVSVPALGGTSRVFTTNGAPGALQVTYPGDYGQQSVQIKVVATTGTFSNSDPGSAEGGGLVADGAVTSGAATFPAVAGAGGALPGGLIGQATASSGALAFGKEFSVRASIALNPAALDPSQMVVQASGPAIWDLPPVGSLYAAIAVPGIAAGRLLFSGNLALYNAVCPPMVLYEAPNHPSVIQAMNQGQMTRVSGVLAAAPGCTPTTANFSVEVPSGRDHIKIENTSPGGKVTVGAPVDFVFTLPSSFVGANVLRVDFGTDVLVGGTVGRVFTLSPVPQAVLATYPPTYTSMTVVVKAVATTGTFLVAAPTGIDISGLLANGATVSGLSSFQVERARPGALTVTKMPSEPVICSGDEVRYTITVTNTSSFPVSNVRVWDSHLGELQTIATLGAGAEVAVNGTARLTTDTRNTARVSALDPFGNTINGTSDEVLVRVVSPEILISKFADATVTKFGRTVNYSFRVENRGDTDLMVTVTDDVMGTIGNVRLPARDGVHVFTRPRAYPLGTVSPVRNIATATGTDPITRCTVTATDEHEVELIETSLSVTVTPSATKVKPGKPVTWTVTVKNTGRGTIRNITATEPTLGNIGTIGELAPDAEQSVTRDENPTSTVTRTFTAAGVDDWEAVTAQGDATVEVVNPSVSVSITANGSATSTKIKKLEKDDPSVTLQLSVTNSGDCDLTNVNVKLDGTTIETFNLLMGETKSAKPQPVRPDKDVTYKAAADGTDPTGDRVSALDAVRVEIDKGVAAEAAAAIAGDADRLLNEIDQLRIKMKAAHQELDAKLAHHRSINRSPCDDEGAKNLLQTAASIHAKVLQNVAAVNNIISNPLATGIVWLGSKKIDWADIAIRFATAKNQTEPEVKKHLEDMQAAWAAAGCGSTPGAKGNLVTIAGQVVDKSGNPIEGAMIFCGGKNLVSGKGGTFSVVIPLDQGDEVSATGSAEIPGTIIRVSGAGRATFDGSTNPLALVVIIDTNPVRPVKVTGVVTDASGNPLVGATVTSLGVTGITKAGGVYELDVMAPVGKPIPVTATMPTKGGGQSQPGTGASAPFQGEDRLNAPISLTSVEMEQEFMIAGMVVDANGAGLPNVDITANGKTAKTGGGGAYSVGSFLGSKGTKISVNASFTDQNNKQHASSTTVDYQGGATVTATNIAFSDLNLQVTFTVDGRVVDSKGNALDGATVTLQGGFTAVTQGGGNFSGLGPVKAASDEKLSVEAVMRMVNGVDARGSNTVSARKDGSVTTVIVIAEAVTQEPFTVTGLVTDSKGNPIAGASVTVGSKSGTTGADGRFAIGEFTDKVGTSLPVSVTAKGTDGTSYPGGGDNVQYSGGKSADAGTISIPGVEVQGPPKKLASLSISPMLPRMALGSMIHFTATATYDDKTTANVSDKAGWSMGTGVNWVVVKDLDMHPVEVLYGDLQAGTQFQGTPVDLGSAIDSTMAGDPNLCNADAVQQTMRSLEREMAKLRRLAREFDGKYETFMKMINDQTITPCENQSASATFVGAKRDRESYSAQASEAKSLAGNIIARKSVCPNLTAPGALLAGGADPQTLLLEVGNTETSMTARIGTMESRLRGFGCDIDKINQQGNQTAGNTNDPQVGQDGGNGAVEKCDGKDNNLDGQIDEGCAGQTGANITIVLFDSGNARDDVFGLTVSGKGSLGTTPAGGLRTYAVSLAPGTYTATVSVIFAPDDIGTFTINISENGRVLASQSGQPPQGGGATVPFTVGAPPTMMFVPVVEPGTITFDESPTGSGGGR